MALDKYKEDFTGGFDVAVQVLCKQVAQNYTNFMRKALLKHAPKSLGLKVREMSVLLSVYFYQIGATPKQIAKILSYDPSTVTRAVARLKAAGLIEQESNIEDTRSAWITLTAQGVEAVQLCYSAAEAHIESYENASQYQLSDRDKDELLSVLMRIRARSIAIENHKP